MHLSLNLVFKITAMTKRHFVNHHGVELGIDSADFRPASIYFLEGVPQTLWNGDEVFINLKSGLQVLFIFAEKREVVYSWRTRDPVLTKLLR